ncbi:cell wall integrity and stress response component 1 [Heracleum sosnowskyi]|uniref:Cell wall integrity and stress response component 1 n=1 Tax=Heracleum sosnowskyi TaxID=360622 RepID=A0AAD8IGS1_9APIA|nr:cell wall integrity and stress response component 1 [Heracleum sosnowskyi]
MGRNGSYNQIHHHRNLSTSSTNSTSTNTSTAFLPLLCRISTKDVAEIPHKKTDPSSPKVSCMGQIKRHNNTNKINTNTITTRKLGYTQLKKIFSSRNILITTSTTTRNSSNYCKGNKNNRIEGGEQYHRRTKSENCGVVVPLNLAELDPPLPVVKSPRCSREGGSLWKRRGGGSPLGGLQIQRIQLPVNNSSCLLITPPSVP